MKMKKVMVTFEKRMSMQVYAPEDMTNDQIKDIAEGLASEGLREWDDPDWSAYVGKLEDVNVSDDELKSSPPNRWGFKTCQSPTLKKGLVISDDRQDIVNADDADWWSEVSTILPDLRDPATIGCLLLLVRAAWKSPVAQVSPSLPDGYLWSCYINDEAEDRYFREKTEAEALVSALETAP